MKPLIKKFILIIILTFNYSNLSAIENVKIILKINNEIITNVDVENEYNYLIALNNDFRKIQKEKYFNLSIKSKVMPDIIKNLYTGIDLKSLDEFKNYLKKYNVNYLDIEKKINIESAWNELIYNRYKDNLIGPIV